MERKIAKEADYLVAMAPEFCRMLQKHGIEAEKCFTITGGFDPEDYPDSAPVAGARTDDGHFTMVYTGLVYESFQPVNLMKALAELIKDGVVDPDKIKVEFVGNTDIRASKEMGLGQVCVPIPYLPRKEVNFYLKKAHLLLLLLSDQRGVGVIPTKTFDYMAAGKPILALVPPGGAVADIIRKTNTGTVVDFEDVAGIKKAFYHYYSTWRDSGGLRMATVKEEIAKYDQRQITRKFCSLLGRNGPDI